MGRVCPAPCESGCNRNQVEDFVGINSVETSSGVRDRTQAGLPEADLEHGQEGGGDRCRPGRPVGGLPTGAQGPCGDDLRRARRTGRHDALRHPGLRTPRAVLDAEIQRILDLGVATRMACRIGTDVTLEQIRSEFDAVFLGLGAQSGRPLPVEGWDAPTSSPPPRSSSLQRRPHAACRQARGVVGGGDTSIDVATVARRLGHIDQVHESDGPRTPSPAMPPTTWHAVGAPGRRRDADVGLRDRQDAGQQGRGRACTGRRHRDPWWPGAVAVIRGADGRATALRVVQCEARFVSGRLEIKQVAGTEEDIEADLIVSAIGQAVDFTGLETLNNGKGGITSTRTTRCRARPACSSAATSCAAPADHCDRPWCDRRRRHRPPPACRGVGQRPKIDVHSFDLTRKMIEKAEDHADRGADVGHRCSTGAIHNYDNRSDRYVIPHTELFLGHFNYTPRNRRKIVSLTAEER